MNLLKRLFKTEQIEQIEPIEILVDIHSHILPGIDDGAENIDESIEMIQGMYELGYRKLITTPHVMGDFYKNTPEIIKEKLEEVQERVKDDGIDVEIEAAAEYYLDEFFIEKLENDRCLTFGNDYLLVETSFMEPLANLNEFFFKIMIKGLKPVFAHPERYVFLQGDRDQYEEIHNKGVLFQINLNSLSGYYSPEAKDTAEWLIEQKLVDFVGSDAHKPRHVKVLNDTFNSKNFLKLSGLNLRNNEL